jgi:hypothetical protein
VSWWGWILLGVFVLVGLRSNFHSCVRAARIGRRPIEWEDVWFGAAMAVLCLPIWPLILGARMIRVAAKDPITVVRFIGGASAKEKRQAKEAEQQARGRRIEQAERELGLGKWAA